MSDRAERFYFRDRMIAAPLKRGKVIKSFFEGRKISAIE